jgi:hypothetical protein
MIVHIPSPLFSYTARHGEVDAAAASLAELLWELDRRFPGIRFRMIDEQDGIRQHIRFFVNGEPVYDLRAPIPPDAEVHIICAISGGSAPAA